jgi:hypothetical protein
MIESTTADQTSVSAVRLDAHVRELAGTIGERNVFRPRALQVAADYIEATWRAQGYAVTSQAFDAYGVRCVNLEASRTGTTRPDEILLIGAHYDSVRGCPGANDNASGVAALLELARGFAALAPALTVRFVAFVNEEPPSFATGDQGSVVYARAARARGDAIRLMVSLETIGCYLETPGSQRYPPLFRHFFPIGAISSGWCPISVRARRSGAWPAPSSATPTSRSSTSRPSAGCPASPGAIISRSGARATARSWSPTPRSTATATTTPPRTPRTS